MPFLLGKRKARPADGVGIGAVKGGVQFLNSRRAELTARKQNALDVL